MEKASMHSMGTNNFMIKSDYIFSPLHYTSLKNEKVIIAGVLILAIVATVIAFNTF